MTDIVERLSKAITTHANDDFSHPRTLGRERFCQRRLAMLDAADEITRLRAKVAKLKDAHLAIIETTEGVSGTLIQECRQISRAAYREADT